MCDGYSERLPFVTESTQHVHVRKESEFKTARAKVQEVRLEPGRALTLRFVMLSARSLSRSTERCVLVMCCTHVLTGMCMSTDLFVWLSVPFHVFVIPDCNSLHICLYVLSQS